MKAIKLFLDLYYHVYHSCMSYPVITSILFSTSCFLHLNATFFLIASFLLYYTVCVLNDNSLCHNSRSNYITTSLEHQVAFKRSRQRLTMPIKNNTHIKGAQCCSSLQRDLIVTYPMPVAPYVGCGYKVTISMPENQECVFRNCEEKNACGEGSLVLYTNKHCLPFLNCYPPSVLYLMCFFSGSGYVVSLRLNKVWFDRFQFSRIG